MQQITFDELLSWLRGYKPKCTCGSPVYNPRRVHDPEGLGREVYATYCIKAHSLYFEVVGEIKYED